MCVCGNFTPDRVMGRTPWANRTNLDGFCGGFLGLDLTFVLFAAPVSQNCDIDGSASGSVY